MKNRLINLFLIALLVVPAMTGCQAVRKAESAGPVSKSTEETIKTTAPSNHASPVLTLEEAQSIALNHAGFAADQVTALHTEYEIEHGVPQYEVEFHYDGWEYDYEIHADTGEILSYRKDDL